MSVIEGKNYIKNILKKWVFFLILCCKKILCKGRLII